MQAILRGKHDRFCKMVQDLISSQEVPDRRLAELEAELNTAYQHYLERITDIKGIIQEYEEKQKELRYRMRKQIYMRRV